MRIDFSSKLTSLDGNAIMADGEELTLNAVATNVLLATIADGNGQPEQLSGETKARNARLALEIHGAKQPIDVRVEDVALLKDRVGRACLPLVVMRAWALLDPPSEQA